MATASTRISSVEDGKRDTELSVLHFKFHRVVAVWKRIPVTKTLLQNSDVRIDAVLIGVDVLCDG